MALGSKDVHRAVTTPTARAPEPSLQRPLSSLETYCGLASGLTMELTISYKLRGTGRICTAAHPVGEPHTGISDQSLSWLASWARVQYPGETAGPLGQFSRQTVLLFCRCDCQGHILELPGAGQRPGPGPGTFQGRTSVQDKVLRHFRAGQVSRARP